MLALRLPDDVENRLAALAKTTGRTKSNLAREAILEHLDDLEDLYIGDLYRWVDGASRRQLSISFTGHRGGQRQRPSPCRIPSP